MTNKLKPLIPYWIFALLFLAAFPCIAEQTSTTQKSIESLIRYLDLKNVSSNDIASLAQLKDKAESSGITADERKATYQELFNLMGKLQGSNPSPKISDFLVSSAMSWSCPDGSVESRPTHTKAGELGDVIKSGSGKIPVILIPDIGNSASVFDTFIRRNEHNYTMFAVTLAGFGHTGLPPAFQHRDYAQLRLWKNAEAGIMSLIKKEKIKQPVLIGHQAGAYLAMRIALDHPELARSVIVLNGLLYVPVFTASTPGQQVDKSKRLQMVGVFLPIELFPMPSQECYSKYWMNYASGLCKDEKRAEALARDGAESDPHVAWDYFSELFSTDLTDEIKLMKTPLLVIPSIPDNATGKPAPDPPAVTQWRQLQMTNLTIVPFKDTRAFATEDNPQLLDQTISDFLKK